MSWTKHDIYRDHENGEPTRFWMQTDGKCHVLSEHPENMGPHVSTIATKYGDELARKNLDADPKNKPENVRLYAERRDGRFDQWEAKTIREMNVSNQPNRFESKPSEWLWKNAHQHEPKNLERQIGARIEQGNTPKSQQSFNDRQNKELREAPLSKREDSAQIREEARAQQRRHPKH